MRYEDWTFREAEVRLAEHSELRAALGLPWVPDCTTVYRFHQRLDEAVVRSSRLARAWQAPRLYRDRNHHHLRWHLGPQSIIPARRGKASWRIKGAQKQCAPGLQNDFIGDAR
jgi:hypothetical protein